MNVDPPLPSLRVACPLCNAPAGEECYGAIYGHALGYSHPERLEAGRICTGCETRDSDPRAHQCAHGVLYGGGAQ